VGSGQWAVGIVEELRNHESQTISHEAGPARSAVVLVLSTPARSASTIVHQSPLIGWYVVLTDESTAERSVQRARRGDSHRIPTHVQLAVQYSTTVLSSVLSCPVLSCPVQCAIASALPERASDSSHRSSSHMIAPTGCYHGADWYRTVLRPVLSGPGCTRRWSWSRLGEVGRGARNAASLPITSQHDRLLRLPLRGRSLSPPSFPADTVRILNELHVPVLHDCCRLPTVGPLREPARRRAR
jgi:hypothetical protein